MNATELTVMVYLNTTTDELDRPLGIIDGYDQTHSFEQVAQWIDTTTPGDRPITPADLHTIAEHAFFLFNVGDDPDMTGGAPDPRAIAYRAAGHRSLSVGDLVTVGETALAVASCGFDTVALPHSLTTDPAIR